LKDTFKQISSLFDTMSWNLDLSSQGSIKTKTDASADLDTVVQRRMNEHRRENSSNQKKKHRHGKTRDKFSSSSHQNRHILEMHEAMWNGDSSFLERKRASPHRHKQARSHTSHGRRMGSEDEESEKQQQCRDLVKCTKAMSLYDIFVYYYSDDIDPETGSIDDNRFSFDEGKDNEGEKDGEEVYSTNKNKSVVNANVAAYGTAGELDPCDLLLQKFHRTIEFEDSNNWQGLMVGQVCLAEGTTVYVKPTVIESVTSTNVATQVFNELFNCGMKLFEARLYDRTEIGSYNDDETYVFLSPGRDKLRIPTGFDLTAARDIHGQYLSSDKYPFTFDEYDLGRFRTTQQQGGGGRGQH
jgi:hypothetical protein